MSRGLGLTLLPVLIVALGAHGAAAPAELEGAPILQRFLSIDNPSPTQYRALRHLEARNDHFSATAWMDVWTEADGAGFRYSVVGAGGSDYIRSHLFRATLEAEQKLWAPGAPQRAALTPANYVFEDRAAQHEPEGLVSLGVKPRRKDTMLVAGSIFLNPADGDLVRIEGRLAKSPSFWTRQVEIVRRYQRFAGVRMPVAMESVANVRIAGVSTFRMVYEYESVNRQRVGSPQPNALRAQAQP